MNSVQLNDQEWGQLMSILSEAPWKIANPLLMKIGEQLRLAHQPPHRTPPGGGIKLDANGREIPHE